MARIKVVHCVDTMDQGGLEQIVRLLVQESDPSKFEPEVWCIASGGEMADQLVSDGHTVRVLGLRTYHNPWNVLKLAFLFIRHRPTVIHSHIYYASTISRIAAKIAGVPVILAHMHNVYTQYKKRNLWIDRLLSHWSDRVICCSKAVWDFVVQKEGIQPDKAVIVYNGINQDRFSLPFDAAKLKSSIGLKQGDLVIIKVALLMPKKGHKNLFDALDLLAKDIPRVRCLLVGHGSAEDEEDLKEYARKLKLDDHVIFLGARRDVADLLRIADLFVLSSLTEGLPLCILEAMAAGLAVVATDVGGVKEILEDNVTGLIVPPQDSRALYKAIKQLMGDPIKAKQMGEKGLGLVAKKFSSREMVKKMEQIYLDLCRAK